MDTGFQRFGGTSNIYLWQCQAGGNVQVGDGADHANGIRPVVVLNASVKTTGTASDGYGHNGYVLSW